MAHGQAISNSWAVENYVGQYANSNVQCMKPSNIAVTSGLLTITSNYVSPNVQCGNSVTALTSRSYTAGGIMMNSFSFTYGHIAFTASFAAPGSGPHGAVWMIGQNCQAVYKTAFPTTTTGIGSCPAQSGSGYVEIDLAEVFSDSVSVNEQIHTSTSNNDGCTATVANVSTPTNYEVDWSNNLINWYIYENGSWTNTCTVSGAHVPSTAMFLIVSSQVGGPGGTANPAIFPVTQTVGPIRICPTSTSVGNCTQGNASIFDEEWTGTGPLSSVYVGQSFNGNATGLDCNDSFGLVNNQQVSWINDPGYWSNGQIGAGTTINLCGSVTTRPIANGAGTSGNPVDFSFANGATGPCPYANGYNFVFTLGQNCATNPGPWNIAR